MTVDGSMSSGYCSLEEELEDCFFTAKTTFFRNVQSKHPSKVFSTFNNVFQLSIVGATSGKSFKDICHILTLF